MAEELHDVRFKLPTTLNAVLDGLSRNTNTERSKIVGNWVEKILTDKLAELRDVNSELTDVGLEGVLRERRGVAGRK